MEVITFVEFPFSRFRFLAVLTPGILDISERGKIFVDPEIDLRWPNHDVRTNMDCGQDSNSMIESGEMSMFMIVCFCCPRIIYP